jgi:hypothetical protein
MIMMLCDPEVSPGWGGFIGESRRQAAADCPAMRLDRPL